MTKDEIKKALECCAHSIPLSTDCPYKGVDYCGSILKKDALDLITEQEKEIEQLKTNAEILARGVRDFNKENYGLSKKIKKLKAENERFESNMRAVLEIEKKQAKIDVLNELKKRSYRDSVYFPEIKYQHKYVLTDDIDEMIEELKK